MNSKTQGLRIVKKAVASFASVVFFVSVFTFGVSAADVDYNESSAQLDVDTSSAVTTVEESTASTASTTATFKNSYNVVTTKNLNLRKGAGSSYSVIRAVKKGTTFYVVKNSSGNWVNVKDSSGKSGYLPTRYLNKGSGSKLTAQCKTNDSVNLRSGASTNYSVLTVVPKSTVITVSSNSNYNWAKVTYNGKTGYISSQYATFVYKIPVDTSQPLYFKSTSASMYKGKYYQLRLYNNTGKTATFKSSNKNIATVDSYGVVYGKANGSAKITATAGKKSVSYTITVKSAGTSVNISNKSYTTNRDKTIYLTSSTWGVTWSSSDTSVATVKNGLVLCKKQGKAVIYAKTSTGCATCVVTVKGREGVRFTYANPNSAPLNSKITFVAITDQIRTAVKFKVKLGSKTYTVNAASKTKSGNTYVWKGSQKLTSAGSYSVVAYSKYGGKWYKSTGSYGKVFITKATSNTQTTCEERHASNNIISFISNYEGLLSSAEFDPLTSFPCLTVGYGRVIYAGEAFYNNMTKNEAFAYLVDTVENDGYVSKVNSFLTNNKIKFNQYQFDSLVSFVYNCGTGIFANDSSLKSLFLNTYPSSSSNSSSGIVTVSCPMYSGAGTNYSKVKTLSSKTYIKLLSAKIQNKLWYKVQDKNGNIGYVSYKNISITSFSKKGTRDLLNTIKQDYIDNCFVYHHAGGNCYAGLLYRRIDEAEIFYNGDYTRDGSKDKYDLSYVCYKNTSLHCGS